MTDKPEKSNPFFQVLNSQQLAFRLSYSSVVLTLIRQITLVYMKLSEVNHVKNRNMFTTLSNSLHSIDKDIVDKVLREICSDLNLVARAKSQYRLMQVYECLNLAKLPNLNVAQNDGATQGGQNAQQQSAAKN